MVVRLKQLIAARRAHCNSGNPATRRCHAIGCPGIIPSQTHPVAFVGDAEGRYAISSEGRSKLLAQSRILCKIVDRPVLRQIRRHFAGRHPWGQSDSAVQVVRGSWVWRICEIHINPIKINRGRSSLRNTNIVSGPSRGNELYIGGRAGAPVADEVDARPAEKNDSISGLSPIKRQQKILLLGRTGTRR